MNRNELMNLLLNLFICFAFIGIIFGLLVLFIWLWFSPPPFIRTVQIFIDSAQDWRLGFVLFAAGLIFFAGFFLWSQNWLSRMTGMPTSSLYEWLKRKIGK